MSFDWIGNPEIWISFVTLTVLEVVLGIDNIIFIAILAGKLPKNQQKKARQVGLTLALVTRILLLSLLAWMVKLQTPLFGFELLKHKFEFSGRDLILLAGGLFLLAKSTYEIHEKLEVEDGEVTKRMAPTFASVIVQILLLDIVFSLDSVITAVGMVKEIWVMIAAVIVAVGFMLVFGGQISAFIERHPTLKMLALSFLLLIGFVLVLEGFHREVPKGYIYFALVFSLGVEMINIRLRKKHAAKVELHQPYR
jgi:predicted tellurium resistance membrane protein TerC